MRTPKSKALKKVKQGYKNNNKDDVMSGAALGHPIYNLKK